MRTYLALFLTATGLSLLLTPIMRRLCQRFGWYDEPKRDDRRVHQNPIPRLGGVAVYISATLALGCALALNNIVAGALFASRSQVISVLVPAVVVFLFGVYDDLKGVRPSLKLIAQIAAGALFCFLGGCIDKLFVPGAGVLDLPFYVALPLTILWIVAITNAFNLIDGVDGLAAGAALFASVVMLVVSLLYGHLFVTAMLLALAGALIGFLRYNFNPASVFLGDSGSLFIGFSLASLSVLGSQKASTAVAVVIPLMAFALPVVDTGFAMARRFISGRPIFEGDREHIHHKLLARGWSQRRVALVLYVACALFGTVALLFAGDINGRITGLLLVVVGVAVIIAVGHLRYDEIEEARAGVRRNLVERRIRVVNNIRVRRAAHALAHAMTLEELCQAVATLLEFGEFVYARMELKPQDGMPFNILSADFASGSLQDTQRATLEQTTGAFQWEWERESGAAQAVDAHAHWTLRLPLETNKRRNLGYINLYRQCGSEPLLLDINYLCGLFQREVSQAAERVLTTARQASRAGQPSALVARVSALHD